ncbi:PDZ domain-containing protein [Horticoccus luteus]|uniref:PDZ domain-containing protein n=1 Tax=Horticoccus luteus TaxID=2862869 RepID=A0A8F9TTU3_9BACT|nr:PDZ domain-containing protein [Horticoccus luteus]QYM77674.1 PDZ domain-containing protein [Horticoccus luteus]
MRLRGLLLFLAAVLTAQASDLSALWAERTKSVAAVEFVVETDIDRRPTTAYGTVIDDEGTIVLPSAAINPRFGLDQYKDFKAYAAGDSVSVPAHYLGQDAVSGWHFVRVDEPLRSKLVPISNFYAAKDVEPSIGADVWGIALRGKDEDFMPYLLSGRVALLQSLPQRTAIAQTEIAGPGLPVFNRAGEFVGVALSSFGQSFLEFSRTERAGEPVMLVNIEESSAFQVAAEARPYFLRVPKNIYGRPLAWLGAYGLQPLDAEVARFMKLDQQSAAVVSEVLENSPAEKAGLKPRDVIVALDGRALPRFRPQSGVVGYVERAIAAHQPGDVLPITVLRDGQRVEIKATLVDEPKLMREAERHYFDRFGFTVRELVFGDAVVRHETFAGATGVIANFVKPNSPAAIAGLRPDDWIKEIDGEPAKDFADAVKRLTAIDHSTERAEFVLLVSRGGETAVLRIKLK